MSKPIEPGCLVIVIKSWGKNEGKTGTAIRHLGYYSQEMHDGKRLPKVDRWLVEFPRPITSSDRVVFVKQAPIRTAWLRRIEGDEVKEEKEDTANV